MKTIMTNVGGPDGWQVTQVDDDWDDDDWTDVDLSDVVVDGVPEVINDDPATAPMSFAAMFLVGRTQTAPLDETRLSALLRAMTDDLAVNR